MIVDENGVVQIGSREEREAMAVDKRNRKLVRAIIISGWVLTLLMMIGIVGSAVLMMVWGMPVPDTLSQWAGVAIGFLFGSFASIIKEFIAGEKG